jgi:hypothetical protein
MRRIFYRAFTREPEAPTAAFPDADHVWGAMRA